MKRIQKKEEQERAEGMDEESIILGRKKKIAQVCVLLTRIAIDLNNVPWSCVCLFGTQM